MTQSLPAEAEPRLRLDDQLCFALYTATNSVVRAYRPLLREIGLTYPQYVVLMALWEEDEVRVGDLGQRLGLPVNGLVPVLDRMEQADLLVRRRSTVDRRHVEVVLTTAGRALESQAARVAEQVRCQTELAPDAVEALRAELHGLSKALDHADG